MKIRNGTSKELNRENL